MHFGRCASGVLAPANFAKKCVLKLVEQFSDHCRDKKSLNLLLSHLQFVHFVSL